MGNGDVVRLDYGVDFQNGAGADIIFTDSRFSDDALEFSLDGTNYFTIAANQFLDSGVDSEISGTGLGFNLFTAAIDLSDFGVAAGAVFSSIFIRGISQSDPIFIGVLNNVGGTAAVPLPGAVLFFASGIAAFGIGKRKKKSA